MSSNKKTLVANILKTNSGCGCHKLNPSDVIQPKPKPKPFRIQKPTKSPHNSSSTFSEKHAYADEAYTSTTFSLNLDSLSQNCSEYENDPTRLPVSKISGSVAVVKDSENPYTDFRQSMLRMIIEREMYSKDELGELVKRFMELNDPTQHDVIVDAFREIWEEVITKRPFVAGKPCEM